MCPHPSNCPSSQEPSQALCFEVPQAFLAAVAAGQRCFVGVNLANADLRGVDLSHLDLRQANLRGANLGRANLRGAHLHHADLTAAHLDHTDFTDTHLRRTQLTRCDLRTAILNPQDWYRANLSWTNLAGQNLSQAQLAWVDFQGANLSGATLHAADLTHAKLDAANLEAAVLTGVRLTGAYLPWAQLGQADLCGAELKGADLTGAQCEQAQFERANVSRVRLCQANLQRANLRQANLLGANLRNTNLNQANCQKANLKQVNLAGTTLVETDARGVELGQLQPIDLYPAITGRCPGDRVDTFLHFEISGKWGVFALSVDAQQLAYLDGRNQGLAVVVDLQTGEKKHQVAIPAEPVVSTVFSADGERLYHSLYVNDVQLWNLLTGELTQTLKAHPDNITAIVLNSEAELIQFTGKNAPYAGIDLGHEYRTCKGYSSGVFTQTESPDGRLVARSHDANGSPIELIDRHTGEMLKILAGHRVPAQSLAFSPDSQMLASYSAQELRVWNIAEGTTTLKHEVNHRTHPLPMLALITPDESRSPVLMIHRCFLILEHREAKHSEREQKGLPIPWTWGKQSTVAGCAALSGNGKVLVRQYGCETAQVWNLQTGQASGSLTLGADLNYPLALNFTGDQLAMGHRDGFSLWDLSTQTARYPFIGHTGYIQALTFSPDGAMIASSNQHRQDQAIKLWETQTGAELAMFPVHFCVTALAFHPVDMLLVSGDYDGVIKFWDLETRQEVHSIQAHQCGLQDLAFSADGRYLVSSGEDRAIKVWRHSINMTTTS